MKSFVHRSYSTHFFRPKPEVLSELENHLVVVATPWGARTSAEKAVQSIQDNFLSARGDLDATSPFEFLTCLSPEANDLRASVMLANDKIFNEENQHEYSTACELVVLAQVNAEVIWVQVGQPGLFLLRKGSPPLPLGTHLDLALDVHPIDTPADSPLPASLLGLHKTSNFSVHSISAQKNDKILLTTRTYMPAKFYSLNESKWNLDGLVQTLSHENPDNPFWLGLIEF